MTKEQTGIAWKSIWRFVFLVTGLLLIALFAHYRYYPHGLTTAKLTTFMTLLNAYANEHDGWYPNGGPTPLASLQKLIPYCDPRALAGMSGNEKKVSEYIKTGKNIDETVSSWTYFPGFRNDDDPEIAILWEREAGLFVNGSRAEGHAVGFVGGGYDQIPDNEWTSFLKRQEQLRQKVLAQRARDRNE